MMITVASFEIASNISQDSYGLVFGINTFLALAFQVFKSVQILKKWDNFQIFPSVHFHFLKFMFFSASE